MLLILLSATALAVLLLVLWTVRGGSKPLSKGQIESNFYVVDVAAFRNLLSQDDEDFLRSSLTSSHYHRVRRARMRAIQEYLLWIATNCATLIALLRIHITDPQLESAPDTERLVRNALRLRMISLGFWALLWVEFLLPGMEIRPAAAVRLYEDVWRFAENYFRTHLPEPAVFAREGSG